MSMSRMSSYAQSRVVLGDSILHHFSSIKDCNIYSFSGIKILELKDLISRFPCLLTKSSVILVHVGTNDIKSNMLASTLIERFHSLVSCIHDVNPSARILVSSILPRKKDFVAPASSIDKALVREVNFLLRQYSQSWGFYFVASYKQLLHHGDILLNHFRDGVHLQPSGDRLVHQVFCSKLNEIGGQPLHSFLGFVLFLYRCQWEKYPENYL